MSRVFVTGIGLVSPLGNDVETSWKNLCAGKSAAGRISHFDATGWPVDIACEVKNFVLDPHAISEEQKSYLNDPGLYSAQAAFEAFQSAGLSAVPNPERSGVYMGTGIGVIKPTEVLNAFKNYDIDLSMPKFMAYLEDEGRPFEKVLIKNHPSTLNAVLSERWNLGGESLSFSTACSSGAQAIGYGYRKIRDGEQDLMLVGGTDALAGELLLAGFCLLGVLSSDTEIPEKAARPFDRSRLGFVAGEGAAVLILESEESVKARGAEIISEVSGYGESENAYRITDLPEDGAGALYSMKQALSSMSSPHLSCVNAHGTGTAQNDKVESLAVEKLMDHFKLPPPLVTAHKPQIGHFIAGSGAVEAIFSCLALRDQKVPAILNFERSDCSERLRYASERIEDEEIITVLSNSFGFGGTNSSILFERSP